LNEIPTGKEAWHIEQQLFDGFSGIQQFTKFRLVCFISIDKRMHKKLGTGKLYKVC
jgi:hypothetical protein